MVTLQVRNFPEQERDKLMSFARERGQSLSSYMAEVMLREARFLDNRDLIDRSESIAQGTTATLSDVISVLDAGRAGR